MDVFFALLFKIFPLYLFILLGFIFGKLIKINPEKISVLLIYFIIPVIIFHGSYSVKLKIGLLSLPIISFLLSSFMCLLFYKISKNVWQDNSRNILAFSAGIGNTGFFGLPVISLILGINAATIVSLILVGTSVYQATIGFFIVARGKHSISESLDKLIKLPLIYAFLLGLFMNLLKVDLGPIYLNFYNLIFLIYSILGMMTVGLAFSEIKKFVVDFKFVLLSFLARFIVWPLLTLFLIFVDNKFLKLFSSEIYKTLFIISLVPLAANTANFASLLKVQPQKAAVAVLLSTIFALFYIPFIISIFKI